MCRTLTILLDGLPGAYDHFGMRDDDRSIATILDNLERLAQIGHWSLDLVQQRLVWSDEVYKIHGYGPGEIELSVESAIEFYHPNDRDVIRNAVRAAIEAQAEFDLELRIVRKDRAIRKVRALGMCETDSAGQPVELFGVFQDVTNEREREESYRLLSSVVEHTQEGILITDAAGYTRWVNHGFLKITGYTRTEVVGEKPGHLLQGPQTDPDTVRFMSEQLAAGRPFTSEVLNYTKEGKPYWLRLSVHPRYDETGTLTHFMAVESDITREKEREQRLEEEIARRKELEVELKRQALEDTLTGVPNKRYFTDHFKREINRTERSGESLGLLVIDIDHFKAVNDKRGHAIGDIVLREIAQRIRRSLRPSDFLARYGGEEFVVVSSGSKPNQAEDLAERLRLLVASAPVELAGEEAVSITCSFGVAYLQDTETADSLFERADAALYRSKRNGRNQVTKAKPGVRVS